MEFDLALTLVGIALALAALLLTLASERKRRPALRIEAKRWEPDKAMPWKFATVQVVNDPVNGLWRRILFRQSAEGCIVSITIQGYGDAEPVVCDLPGRWSGTPEPFRTEFQPDGQGGWDAIRIFDHSLVPGSFRFSIPSTGVAEEVAIAVWRDGKAYFFNSWSYAYPGWANPDWYLDHGTYEVTVRANAPGCEASATFTVTVSEAGLSDLAPSEG